MSYQARGDCCHFDDDAIRRFGDVIDQIDAASAWRTEANQGTVWRPV